MLVNIFQSRIFKCPLHSWATFKKLMKCATWTFRGWIHVFFGNRNNNSEIAWKLSIIFIKKTMSCYPITKETLKHCQLNLNYRSWAGIVPYISNPGGRQRQMDQSLFEINCVYTAMGLSGLNIVQPETVGLENYGASCFGDVSQWYSDCSVSTKSWLQSPITAENICTGSFKNRSW